MKKNCGKLIMAEMLILVFMAGCRPSGNVINDGRNETVSENADDSGEYEKEWENPNNTELEQNQNSRADTKSEQSEENKNSQSKSQPQATATTEELEKELAAYRDEREKATWLNVKKNF